MAAVRSKAGRLGIVLIQEVIETPRSYRVSRAALVQLQMISRGLLVPNSYADVHWRVLSAAEAAVTSSALTTRLTFLISPHSNPSMSG
jgi:hypothetical protein